MALLSALLVLVGSAWAYLLTFDEKRPVARSESSSVIVVAKMDPQDRRSGKDGGIRVAGSGERGGFDREILITRAGSSMTSAAQRLGLRSLDVISLPHLGMVVHHFRVPDDLNIASVIRTLRTGAPGSIVAVNSTFAAAARTDGRPRTAGETMGWDAEPRPCRLGARIGIIDTRVNTTHSAFRNARIEAVDFRPYGTGISSPDHGTAIAAILVGSSEWGGLLPNARLFAANIFGKNFIGQDVATAASLLKALEWLASQDVEVVNLSLTGEDNKLVREAFSQARRLNLQFVAAVGQDEPYSVYPAAYSNVIAITASDPRGTILAGANKGRHVDFAAPGKNLRTVTGIMSGTSLSSAIVTGLLPLVTARQGMMNTEDIRDELKMYAADLGNPGRDETFGWGMLAAGAKLNELRGAACAAE